MKKIVVLFVIIMSMTSTTAVFGQEGNVPKDLLNDLIWMDGQTRNVFGYPITRIFGNDNISNERYHGNRFASKTSGGMLSVTNIGYIEFDDVLKDLQKAWNKHNISLPVQKYLEDSLRNISGGGYIYIYIERPSQDAANLKYFFTVVRDQSDNKKFSEFSFPRQTSQLVAGKGNWWNYYIIPMKKIPNYPFYVYVNNRQTEDLSDFKFKIDAPSYWETIVKPVHLIADELFGQNNNWNNIFKSDISNNQRLGSHKSLVVLPDGSVVVSHADKDYYTLFDKNGKFIKEFDVKREGKSLKNLKPIKGIINNNTFFTALDNMGNMQCFDFNGNYVKTLKINYQVSDMVALNNNKIAVVGNSSINTKVRFFIALIDFNTNEERIIWDHYVDKKEYDINFNPKIAFMNQQIIAAFPTLGGIMIFDNNGKLKTHEKISWVKYISVEEQKNLIRKNIEDLKTNPVQKIDPPIDPQKYKEEVKEIVQLLENKINTITEPKIMTAFSTMLKNSDNQLLFFEIPEKEGENRFHVWACDDNGKFVGKYMFVCNDYDLSITPSKMVYYNGYIYSLQNAKKSEGVPMRLVRFRVEGLE